MADRKTLFSWCLYDWANSPFTTLVVTFVYSTFFTQQMTASVTKGTLYWSWAIGASAVAVALLSPILGTIADQLGRRKALLINTTGLCALFTCALAFIGPDTWNGALYALICFALANTCYELAIVFYNAYLPDIAKPERIGTLSGYGWGLGYAGGIAGLLAAFFLFLGKTPLLPLPQAGGFHYRATNLLVAAWLICFSLPFFLTAPKTATGQTPKRRSIARQLASLRAYPQSLRFLIAHLIYNDGLVTIFAFGGVYAAGTFHMSIEEVLLFGVALNVAAGIGAFLFGRLDDIFGGRNTVLVSILALISATILAVVAPDKKLFWLAGILVGIFAGPNQAASRSLMGRFAPADKRAEFYGLFTMSGKITSFLGPILLGITTAATDNQRAGVATILLFFLTGIVLLFRVDETRGIEEADT